MKFHKPLIIFVALSLLASAINYIAYPLLGRLLPADQYVDITLALSLFTQITTFLSSITAITIGITKQDEEGTSGIIAALQHALFRAFLVLILIFLVLSPMIFSAINTPLIYAIPVVLMMFASLPITIISGVLNGKKLLLKLGVLTVVSACSQLVFGAVAAALFNDGFIAMTSMALGQLFAIVVIYRLFKSVELPKISSITQRQTSHLQTGPAIRQLVLYTAIASVAIMLVSIMQIADLVIINARDDLDSRLYTDVYIISRVVFFAGMIFIWPFLGEIDISAQTSNKKPLRRLLVILAAITVGMVLFSLIFGSQIIALLLGVRYNQAAISALLAVSIVFKFFMLIVTAATLYLIVLRRRVVIAYAVSLLAIILLYVLLSREADTLNTLISISTISGLWSLIGVWLILRNRNR